MSTGVYERMQSREDSLWKPFLYDVERSTGAATEKTVVFGLYAKTYAMGQNYLTDIETEKLAWLLSEYNSKVELLTAEQTALTLNIAAKRYLANLDLLLEDEKINYQRQKNTQDAAYWSARLSAVNSDREALETKRLSLAIIQENVVTKLTQIENEIALEGLRQSEVDIEVSRKELDVLRIANESIKVDLEVIQLQQRVSEIGLDMIEVDHRLGNIEIDITEVEARTARIGHDLLNLEREKVERDTLQYQVDNDKTVKQSLIDAKQATIDADTENLSTIEGLISDKKNSRIQQITDDGATDISILEANDTADELLKKARIATQSIDESISNASNSSRVDIANKNTEINAERQSEAASDYSTAVYAASVLASANIANTLEHSIEAG